MANHLVFVVAKPLVFTGKITPDFIDKVNAADLCLKSTCGWGVLFKIPNINPSSVPSEKPIEVNYLWQFLYDLGNGCQFGSCKSVNGSQAHDLGLAAFFDTLEDCTLLIDHGDLTAITKAIAYARIPCEFIHSNQELHSG